MGLDARGFIFGPLVAAELGLGFVQVRKPDKLPGDLVTISYDLEYGSNSLSLQRGCLPRGTKVLIVDDLIATGGSMVAGEKCAFE